MECENKTQEDAHSLRDAMIAMAATTTMMTVMTTYNTINVRKINAVW